jgi:hypothetical protein
MPGLAIAQQPLDPARFQAVLAAARSYAVDVSLCIEGEVGTNYARILGLGVPLVRRPPFDRLGR